MSAAGPALCYTPSRRDRPAHPVRPPMPEWLGFILLVVGLVVAATLAILVTRWALHMNEE